MDPTDDKSIFAGGLPQSSRPIRLSGSELGPRRIARFSTVMMTSIDVLLPFIKDGLECGEKAVHIGGILQKNPFFVSPDEFLRELRDRRIRLSVSSVEDRKPER